MKKAEKLNELKIAYSLAGDKGHCPDVRQLIEEFEGLQAILEKIVLCFPDIIPKDKETVEFNIPAYIIEDARNLLK